MRATNRSLLALAMPPIAFMMAACPAIADTRVEVGVSIVGIETFEGKIVIAVFDTEESFDERVNSVAFAYLPAESAVVSWSTELVAPAVYAIAVYHDLNGNGELDMKLMGGPREPYGFSNNARGVFGPPSFEDAQIRIELERYALEIEVR